MSSDANSDTKNIGMQLHRTYKMVRELRFTVTAKKIAKFCGTVCKNSQIANISHNVFQSRLKTFLFSYSFPP